MTPTEVAPLWASVPTLLAVLVVGVYVTAVLDAAVGAAVAGGPVRGRTALLAPFRRAALHLRRSGTTSERPDALLWVVAAIGYGALALLALAVIPPSGNVAAADVRTGIVVFGAAEMLLMVAVFLHGWSANAQFSLIGGYRFIALALSFMLLEMFVLIAASLPAESLSVGRIVEAQSGLWNVLAQPLGLPLFLVVALGAAFWGPLNFADGAELAGGTSAEVAGPQRLVWEFGRRAVLVTYAAMTAAAFLGGHHGPWLPGAAWLAVKTAAVLAVLVVVGHLVGRIRPERFVVGAWVVLLPLAFVDLAIAGVVAL